MEISPEIKRKIAIFMKLMLNVVGSESERKTQRARNNDDDEEWSGQIRSGSEKKKFLLSRISTNGF
jgi:hypothetical protein